MSHGTISDCYSRLASCGKLDYTSRFFFFFFFFFFVDEESLSDFKFLLRERIIYPETKKSFKSVNVPIYFIFHCAGQKF